MRMRSVGAVWFVFLVGGCSAGGTDNGGTGGRGTSGGGTSGGTLGQFPSCLQELFATCPRDGTCIVGNGSICYSSGVRTVNTSAPLGCGQQSDSGSYTMTTAEVHKPDGTLCYTEVMMTDCTSNGEAGVVTWTNASGNEVASASFGYSSWTIHCSATGDSTSKSCGTSACDLPWESALPACTTGSCP